MTLPRFRTLSTHFLVVGGLLMIAVMIIAGFVISNIVARDVVRSTAASTALFLHAVAGNLVSELTTANNTISSKASKSLDALFHSDPFRQRFPYVEIWNADGTIAYSTSPELIGRRFDPPQGLLRALSGEVAAEYTDLDAEEHTIRGIESRFLEIYSPIRDATGDVVAVAEIHEAAEPLETQLANLRMVTWAVVGVSTLLITASLFGIVHRGSKTIERQATALRRRIDETERISEQNHALKDKARHASARVSELNEKFLMGLGADLHDGPSQLISFAILQTSDIAGGDAEQNAKRTKTLASTLDQALREIRSISKGLLMPDIQGLPPNRIIEQVTKIHQSRTATSVATDLQSRDVPVVGALATCIYRFVQEGLNNAQRHAGGVNLIVKSATQNGELVVSVVNGRDPDEAPGGTNGVQSRMGLYGLRNRVESLGGTLNFSRLSDGGAILEMRVDLEEGIVRD